MDDVLDEEQDKEEEQFDEDDQWVIINDTLIILCF